MLTPSSGHPAPPRASGDPPTAATPRASRVAHWGRWRSWAVIGSGVLLLLMAVGAFSLYAWLEATELPRHPAPASPRFFAGLPELANIAHRGASAEAAEHTSAAYQLALEQGADVLELDLRVLGDGALVVAHDADLRRSHGLERRLDSLSLGELGERLGKAAPLTLREVFRQFRGARFNLELKDDAPRAARRLVKRIDEAGMRERVLVASAHHRVLVEFRNASQGAIATSASAREVLRFVACHHLGRECPAAFSALQIPAWSWLGLDDVSFVRHAHERNLFVHYFTIDDPAKMRRLAAAGADGIMTNRPERLRRLVVGGLP